MIKISSLSFQYGENKVFNKIDINFPAQKTILITGSNRSGKTSLLRILASIEKNYSGKIDYNIKINKKLLTYKINFIAHQPNILKDKTIYKNLYLPAKDISKEFSPSQVFQLLHYFGFSNQSIKVANLSLSEVKLLEVIKSILKGSYLILFDDFDAFFDDITTKKILNLFNRKKYAGISFIATSKEDLSGKYSAFDIVFTIRDYKLVKIYPAVAELKENKK